MKDNIILIGFMGSGKTSVGVKLSYLLRKTLVDTDKWIEQKQKMSISEIFEKKGEAAFRQMETECLKELLKAAGSRIISVGGGLPLKEENRRLLKQLGYVFYLKASPETVYERLKDDDSRPLLRGDAPLEKIRELMSGREPLYEEGADEVIEVSDRGFDEILSIIIEKMKTEGWA